MRKLVLFLALIMLLAPTATSTWRVGGTHEPDTSYDDETWMWPDAPPAGSNRIYFNAMTFTRQGTGVSPNVALLDTRNEPPGYEQHMVLMGVWADCNGDEYIGHALGAMREYPASLLPTTSICPAVNGPAKEWVAGAHNYNGWVSEFIWIGTSGSQRTYLDSGAAIWGDYHRPDEKPTWRSCALYPLPRGTSQSTGGILTYAECRLNQRDVQGLATFNAAVDLIGDPLGLRFQNEKNATSGPLGQVKTLGSDKQEYSPATVWDCESAPVLQVSTVRVHKADPKLGNTDPDEMSVAAFVNTTYDGAPTDNCDPSDDDGVYPEADFLGVDPDNKTQSDWNFKYSTGPRGGIGIGLIQNPLGPGASGAPNDGGFGWGTSIPAGHAGWYGDSVFASKGGPRLVRASLGGGGVGFASAYWLTFYGFVGDATTQRAFEKTPGEGVYGSWHCGGMYTGGIRNGWNCDPDMWYRNLDGSYLPAEGQALRGLPGQKYHFRDVDCYDGGNALGVGTGGPAYGPEPCT